MKPELTPQILGMYIGCEVDISQTEYGKKEKRRLKSCVLRGLRDDNGVVVAFLITNIVQHSNGSLWLRPEMFRLKLRQLSDMTEEELKDFANYMVWIEPMAEDFIKSFYDKLINANMAAAATVYLASRGFDLLGLIPASLAVDATTLKNDKA